MRGKRVTLTDIDGYVREEYFTVENTDSQRRSLDLHRILFEHTTEKQKRYLLMYYRDKLTMDEIAVRCGVAKSTVSRTVARGRNSIIRGLRDDELRRLIEKLKR